VPDGAQLIQMAFVVENMQRAIETYRRQLNAGPWFLIERFTPAKATYRGRPTNLVISVAFAYRDDVMLELVEQHDDSPSVFRDVMAERGYGLHHLGLITSSYQSVLGQYVSTGYKVEFAAETPGRLAIMRSPGLPYMVEILELDERRRLFFDRMHAASRRWDGLDPIRPVSAT
jgi:hypothetical protein